jgi:hypothetical protein
LEITAPIVTQERGLVNRMDALCREEERRCFVADSKNLLDFLFKL